ncbi:hypothetical protein M406DRAFT_75242 [Cryphonectria parasitica EP155]|uniref:DUF6603 domain-containing protein n=1 Tax=Cryphonectria parasitica (strain ATCC 38755 / EP155) TaxID=660469 RepID=A0A9P4Y004_CRYP1|nr:uncharacterized protein M406DRAFT_75242 [Cryphonectria parasitica EP155]KAF3764018.1 hypothetical protein M406DRAFT_75242 [Cryphonectria parasitica EP155]
MGESYGIDSIHLNVGDGECTTIIKAVLVDTGPAKASQFGSQVLASSFASVAARYGCATLQFDAIVLSVWHSDYYGGLFEMLNAEIGAKIQEGQQSDSFRVSWLKYDKQNKPLSVLYAPCAPPSHVPEMKLQTPGNRLTYAMLRPRASQPAFVSGFCNFVCNKRELLGRDLLASGTLPIDFLARPAPSPYDLLARNPPGANMPGLYVVVAGDIVMGSETSVSPEADPSLALLVMWNSKPACISYYGGGHAEDVVQNGLVDLVTAAPPSADVEVLSVTSMKIGGRSGSPVSVADTVNILGLQSLVMFNGSKYNNPRWELILLLHTLLMSQRPDVATSKPAGPTGACSYVDFSGTGQLSFDTFVRPGGEDSVLFRKLDEFYYRVNKRQEALGQPGLLNVYEEYCLWGEDKTRPRTEHESRDWIIHHPTQPLVLPSTGNLLTLWSQRAWSSTSASSLGMPPRAASDGAVSIKYLGSHNVQTYQTAAGDRSVATIRSLQLAVNSASVSALSAPSPPDQAMFSQFPSWSRERETTLAQTRFDHSNVFYNLETLLEPPADALEIPAENNPRLDRLAASREAKSIDTSTFSAVQREVCIASTLLKLQGGVVGMPSILSPGDADVFVGSLHNTRLDLAEKPVVVAARETQKYYEFDKTDELYGWLSASIGATSLKLAPSATNKIANLGLKLSNGLEFCTEHIGHMFDSSSLSTISKEMGGLVCPQKVLVLALDPKCDTGPVRLADLVSLSTLPVDVQDAELMQLLDIRLTLDVQPGSRNAVWFDPERSYRTVQRLQYLGDAESTATMTKFLASRVPWMSVKGVKVVSKSECHWVVTSRGQSVLRDVQTDLVLDCSLRLPGSEAAAPASSSQGDVPVSVVLRIRKNLVTLDMSLNSGDLLPRLMLWLEAQVGSLDLSALLEGEMTKKILFRALLNIDSDRYSVSGGITVGVNYTIEAFWVSTNINAQLGAQICLGGQPFGGRARVEFWVLAFDIAFGNTSQIPESAAQRSINFNATSGLLAPASISEAADKEEQPKEDQREKRWNVLSGLFTFSVGCSFPISSLFVDGRIVQVINETPLFAKPMKRADPISSELHVRVFKKSFRGSDGNLDPAYEKVAWNVVSTTKAMPKGYWDKYDSSKDPAVSGNNMTVLTEGGNNTIKLRSDLVLTPPPPQVSADKLAPIKAGELQKEDALDAGNLCCSPKLEVADSKFAPVSMGTSAEHYEAVANTWATPRLAVPDLLDFWAKSLFWTSKSDDHSTRQLLDTSVPKMYIEKRDRLWMSTPSHIAAV